MPVPLTYPGVYIEEIPSGVRTITGVATSVTAFLGRAVRGPVNEPVTINSMSDFERVFGGLSADSMMSHAVRDFFLNGGSQAIIVRLFHPHFPTEADRQAALVAATAQAQTAADAVSQAAADAVAGAADADAVADAAEAAVAAAGGTGPAAMAAATAVAQAARNAVTATATPQDVADAAAAAVSGAVATAAAAAAPMTRAQLSPGTADADAVADAAEAAAAAAGGTGPAAMAAATAVAQAARNAVTATATPQDVADAAAGAVSGAVAAATAAATAEAQTAADAVSQAAADAVAGAADADAVADAAEAAVAAAGGTGPAAMAAATAVAQAARNAVTATATPQGVADAAAAAVAAAVAAATAAATAEAQTAADAVSQAAAGAVVGGLDLEAAYPGAWGNSLRARVDYDTRPTLPGETPNSLFNLSVKDGVTGQVEVFRNVSVQAGHPRQADRVLLQESNLVRVLGALPTSRPAANAPSPSGIVSPGQDPFGATASTGVITGLASDSLVLAPGDYTASRANKEGLYALEKADLFNLLCIPSDTRGGDTPAAIYQEATKYCVDRRAMLIVDPPALMKVASARNDLTALSLTGTDARNAALYFPRVIKVDPLREGQLDTFVPCGAIAGIMARTDAQRGVWKAPAGQDAALTGTQGLAISLTDAENGQLNPLGINCLRSFPVTGRVVWGARTLRGADQLADEYKYLPVRRLALFIEESLYRGTQWVVFEPNDEPLWAQIRLNIGAFMQNLFRQGAFQGKTPQEAYFVKCDKETTTQNDINLGIVNILVGFAPLKPAEFVVIKIQQIAGQVAA